MMNNSLKLALLSSSRSLQFILVLKSRNIRYVTAIFPPCFDRMCDFFAQGMLGYMQNPPLACALRIETRKISSSLLRSSMSSFSAVEYSQPRKPSFCLPYGRVKGLRKPLHWSAELTKKLTIHQASDRAIEQASECYNSFIAFAFTS